MEDPGWDPLQESLVLIRQLLSFLQAPLEGSFKLRQTLFLYCHITEMTDLYNIVGNLLRVIKGERHSLNCFLDILHSSGKEAKYPQSKVIRIKEWSDEVGLHQFGDLVTDMLVKEVRNAFNHSDYILQPASFNIRYGEGVRIGNMIDRKVKLEWLMPRIELGINFGLAVVEKVFETIRSCKANKTIMGRMHGEDQPPIPIELTVRENYGLIGFKC